MSQDNGSATALTAVNNGRPIKFTPERLEQIRNLVERGKSREEIAEMIGVTLGSLQVTCSRVGISLRQPRPDLAAPMRQPRPDLAAPMRQPTAANHEKSVNVKLSHRHRTIELKLPQDLLGHLAIEAHFENLSLSELMSKLLTSALGNNYNGTA
jgi:hypothetical protein